MTVGEDPLHSHLLLFYKCQMPGNVSVTMGLAYLDGKSLKSFDF